MASAGSSFGGGAPTSLTSSVPTAASCSVRSSVRSQFSDGRLRFGPQGATLRVGYWESGLYFVQPITKKLADSTKFATQLDKERLQVMQAARQDRVRQVLAALREGAKVTDRRKDLEKAQRNAEENPQPAAAQLPRGRRF